MARVTPTEAASKLVRRLSQSTEDIRRGIERVSEAPGAKAAQAADRMLESLTRSITSGEWAEAVSSVSLADWKKAAIDKGLARISPGIQAAEPKVRAFMEQLLPAVDAAVASVDSMPQTTLEDRIQRSVAFQRQMAEFRFRK